MAGKLPLSPVSYTHLDVYKRQLYKFFIIFLLDIAIQFSNSIFMELGIEELRCYFYLIRGKVSMIQGFLLNQQKKVEDLIEEKWYKYLVIL